MPKKTGLVQEVGGKKPSIQRSKGLGENEADMMWLTTMNPSNQVTD
jgi:DNA gyrase subunit B